MQLQGESENTEISGYPKNFKLPQLALFTQQSQSNMTGHFHDLTHLWEEEGKKEKKDCP